MQPLRLTCLAMGVCAMASGAAAQAEWRLGLGTGATRTATADASASPLRYAGWAVPLRVEARRQTSRSTTEAWVAGASTVTGNARPMVNRAGREVFARDEFEAGLSHLRVVVSGDRTRHEAGARLGLAGATRTYDFQDGISWNLVVSLDGVYAYERGLAERGRIRAEGAVTLAGWVHRPPHFLASDELFAALYDGEGSFLGLGRVRAPDALQQGTLGLTYEHGLSERLSLAGTASLRALRITEPETVVTFARAASVRLLVRL